MSKEGDPWLFKRNSFPSNSLSTAVSNRSGAGRPTSAGEFLSPRLVFGDPLADQSRTSSRASSLRKQQQMDDHAGASEVFVSFPTTSSSANKFVPSAEHPNQSGENRNPSEWTSSSGGEETGETVAVPPLMRLGSGPPVTFAPTQTQTGTLAASFQPMSFRSQRAMSHSFSGEGHHPSDSWTSNCHAGASFNRPLLFNRAQMCVERLAANAGTTTTSTTLPQLQLSVRTLQDALAVLRRVWDWLWVVVGADRPLSWIAGARAKAPVPPTLLPDPPSSYLLRRDGLDPATEGALEEVFQAERLLLAALLVCEQHWLEYPDPEWSE